MITFDPTKCVGCGSCVRVCPMGYLGMEDRIPAPRERRRCIQCGHCVATCPRQAVSLEVPGTALSCPAPENALEELIVRRRSVRHFRPDTPPREIIQRALDLAEYAPSGKNAHLHRWTVLYGLEETEKVTQMALDFAQRTGEAKELIKIRAAGTNLLTCDAPCVILAWSPDDALNPVADPALAMALVELQLNRAGLATCWGGYLKQIAQADRTLSAYLGIPEGSNLRCALMVGYAQGERYPNQPPRPRAEICWRG